MFKEYPKLVRLKEGIEATVRLMTKKDRDKLLAFFTALPREERLFLKEDVTDPAVIDGWIRDLNYDKVLPLVAEVDDKIIAVASLHRNLYGWSKHVGEIRVVVAPDYQRKGLGAILAHELFSLAMRMGLEKIMAQMMDNQEGAYKAFKKLGFKKEAVLKDHVIDLQGNKHDLIIMTNNVTNLIEKIDDLIKSHELSIESNLS